MSSERLRQILDDQTNEAHAPLAFSAKELLFDRLARRQADLFKRRFSGAADHFAGRLEAGTVARTVPSSLKSIPADDAAQMSTGR